jgi:hypothetical protein
VILVFLGWVAGSRAARLEFEASVRRLVIDFSPESILAQHAAMLRARAAECEDPRVRRLLEASANSMDSSLPRAKGQA